MAKKAVTAAVSEISASGSLTNAIITICGYVKDKNNKPIPDTEVRIFEEGIPIGTETKTNDEGHYEIALELLLNQSGKIIPKDVSVKAKIEISENASKEQVLERKNVNSNTQINITFDIETIVISGHVKDRNGKPIKEGIMQVYDVTIKSIEDAAKPLKDRPTKPVGLEKITNDDGYYKITLIKDDSCKEGALEIFVMARINSRYFPSEPRIISGDTTIDFDMAKESMQGKSEYEINHQKFIDLLDKNGGYLEQIEKILVNKNETQINYILDLAGKNRDKIENVLSVEFAARLLKITKPADRQYKQILFAFKKQGMPLNPESLAFQKKNNLRDLIKRSVKDNFIHDNWETDEAIDISLNKFYDKFVKPAALNGKINGSDKTLSDFLSLSISDNSQKETYLKAFFDFEGDDESFWLDLRSKGFTEETINRIQFSNELGTVTQNSFGLMSNVLNDNSSFKSLSSVVKKWNNLNWLAKITEADIPENTEGETFEEKRNNYAKQINDTLTKAYPTEVLYRMIDQDSIPINTDLKTAVINFIDDHSKFNIRSSVIETFLVKEHISISDESKNQLKVLQRVFHLSPFSDIQPKLIENNLTSAFKIANIPKRNFIKKYASKLGNDAAEKIYAKAQAINNQTTQLYMTLKQDVLVMSTGVINTNLGTGSSSAGFYYNPAVIPSSNVEAAVEVLRTFPNYEKLFGEQNICECTHCRSVTSAACYMVDLLEFLKKGEPNLANPSLTPRDVLFSRRPDIGNILLTCENTETVIPYIDLANEIMEYYVANNKIEEAAARNTGDTSSPELLANPQYIIKEAYELLSRQVYPFTLPYNQPLDVIRTYLKHIDTNRYELIKTYRKKYPLENELEIIDSDERRALDAEYLSITPLEYQIISGHDFSSSVDVTNTEDYFGFASDANWLLKLTGDFTEQTLDSGEKIRSGIKKYLLSRTGIKYVDLIEIVKSKFLNPNQNILLTIEKYNNSLLRYQASNPEALILHLNYNTIKILTGPPTPIGLNILTNCILQLKNDFPLIDRNEFLNWIKNNEENLFEVAILHSPDSKCDLSQTSLKYLKDIHPETIDSTVDEPFFKNLHRFIRLWRKLGWEVHELDAAIESKQAGVIDPELIHFVKGIQYLKDTTRLPILKLLCLYGDIDTYGSQSLYKKLFLNRTVLELDNIFLPDIAGNYLEQEEPELITDHLQAILSALQISAQDFDLIKNDLKLNDDEKLTISTVSKLYRYSLLSKYLKLKIPDFIILKALAIDLNIDPFYDPDNTIRFIEIAKDIKDSGFKISQLNYIILDKIDSLKNLNPTEDTILSVVHSIRRGLIEIEQLHNFDESEITDEIFVSELSLMFNQSISGRLKDILVGSEVIFARSLRSLTGTGVPESLTFYSEFPDDLRNRITYSFNEIDRSAIITFRAVMTDEEWNIFKDLNLFPDYANEHIQLAIESIHNEPTDFIINNFSFIDFGTDPLSNELRLLLLNREKDEDDIVISTQRKYSEFFKFFLPILLNFLKQKLITRTLSDALKTEAEITGSLLQILKIPPSEDLLILNYFENVGTASQILIPLKTFEWIGYIIFPVSETFSIISNMDCRIFIDNYELTKPVAEKNEFILQDGRKLKAGKFYTLNIKLIEEPDSDNLYLQWQSETTPLTSITGANIFANKVYVKINEVIPPDLEKKPLILDNLREAFKILQKAILVVNGFKLNVDEIEHFHRNKANFENLDFSELKFTHWKRLFNHLFIKKTISQSDLSLIKVFEKANSPDSSIKNIKEDLSQLTDCSLGVIDELVTHFFFNNKSDFANEKIYIVLYNAIQLYRKTGIAVEMLSKFANYHRREFNDLWDDAQNIKNAIKSKYDSEEWLHVSKPLSDKIRESQKLALTSYLTTRPEIIDWVEKHVGNVDMIDADHLYEYFLIDVQMGSCMQTSRIVQANASIQQFIQRCFLNLESEKNAAGKEIGVAANVLVGDTNWWTWMKNYRVWEANRKVFLYPENWLEPELRDNKTPFFKEFEGELLQNDLSNDVINTAFSNYLYKLHSIARLEPWGLYYDEDYKRLYVFSRTFNSPYTYYFRYLDKYNEWSPWVNIPIDIQGVEDTSYSQGRDTGVHLIPIVWKNRLFIFWPIFSRKPRSNTSDNNITNISTNGNDGFSLESPSPPPVDLEIKLAFSEYKNGKWMPKNILKNSIIFKSIDSFSIFEKQIYSRFNISEESIIIKFFYDEFDDTYLEIPHPTNSYEDLSLNYPTSNLTLTISPLQWDSSTYVIWKNKRQGNNNYSKENYSESDLRFYLNFKDTYDSEDQSYSLLKTITSPFNICFLTQYLGLKPADSDISSSTYNKFFFNDDRNIYYVVSIFPNTTISTWEVNFRFLIQYHPYSDEFIKKLNLRSISELLSTRTQKMSEISPHLLFKSFSPNPRYIPDLPVEKVEFKSSESYALYNWELFFHAPLLVAIHLSRNQRFEEAMKWFHYIFDPTSATNEGGVNGYWKFIPFKDIQKDQIDFLIELMSTPDTEFEGTEEEINEFKRKKNDMLNQWKRIKDYPFRPHLIAGMRPLAYMKNVIMKYLDNIISWGDNLFRQGTMESISEALQLYVIAAHILGPRPEFVPKRGEPKPKTYMSLENDWGPFADAFVEFENMLPYGSDSSSEDGDESSSLLGTGLGLYFCVPYNKNLLKYWDTVADRLYKIRHCLNIEGVFSLPPLFSPELDPGMLVRATATGMSLSSILNDLNTPNPYYRFNYVLQKALEICADVKSLGGSILSVLEKKDAESLSNLRASQDTAIQKLIRTVRENQLKEANETMEALLKSRETSVVRFMHYMKLLDQKVTVPKIGDNMAEVNVSLNNKPLGELGVKIIPSEKLDLEKTEEAADYQASASVSDYIAQELSLLPKLKTDASFWGVGIDTLLTVGDTAAQMFSIALRSLSNQSSYLASQASKMGSYTRREEDWILQANLAAKEIMQIDKQIQGADTRISIAEQELKNHDAQIENSIAVEEFLRSKYTNEDLYLWMKGQISSLYFQTYQLAFDLAKKAEKAYKFELGDTKASFIEFGYWDNLHSGLLSGEKLYLALKQMDSAYMNNNRREYELTKHISLQMLDPLSLLQLKETGSCEIEIPELIFDMDYPGHYMRRIKNIFLSIPCIVGPYTGVNCTLALLSNETRISNKLNGSYAKLLGDESEDRFVTNFASMQSIATSNAQNDAGMFELNFRDERYLPFEGAGVISRWRIDLNPEIRQFDYDTISDVIMHFRYTARDGGKPLRDGANTSVETLLNSIQDESNTGGLLRAFSMRHDFTDEWYKFLNPEITGADNELKFILGRERFPYLVQPYKISVAKVKMFAKKNNDIEKYGIRMFIDGIQVQPDIIITFDRFGAQLLSGDSVIEIDVPKEILIKVGKTVETIGEDEIASDFNISAEDIDDLIIVVQYRLEKST